MLAACKANLCAASAARVAALQNDLLETSRQLQNTIQNLKKMALVDELTGAGNQEFLQKNLSAHLHEASTRRGGVCLALVELRELEGIADLHDDSIVNEILWVIRIVLLLLDEESSLKVRY